MEPPIDTACPMRWAVPTLSVANPSPTLRAVQCGQRPTARRVIYGMIYDVCEPCAARIDSEPPPPPADWNPTSAPPVFDPDELPEQPLEPRQG